MNPFSGASLRRGLAAIAVCVAFGLGHAQAAPAPGPTFHNPIINENFPDPMAIRAADGRFYAYATTTMRDGHALNIQGAVSDDLVHWTFLPDVMPTKPSWGQRFGDFWAPHVLQAGATYYLYYSARPDTDDRMAIGVATSSSPKGPFVDCGVPLDLGPGIDNIDPCVVSDETTGRSFIYWGSDGKPIHVRELASDRLRFNTDTKATVALDIGKAPYERLLEAPYVIHRGAWWYLFTSGDDCCDAPHYAVMVARSKSPLGPFERLATAKHYNDSVILRAGLRWLAPGHNGIVTDAKGHDWIIYHAVDRGHPRFPNGKDVFRPCLIDRVGYQDGWPVVGLGVPSDEELPAPAGR